MPPLNPSSNGTGSDPGPSGLASNGDDPMPNPGELNIKEKRAWKTWQLGAGMVAAALFGMALNYHAVGASSSSSSSSAPAYKLPTSGSTTTTAPSSASGASGSTTTTAAGGSTTTTAAGGSTTATSSPSTPTTAATGQARVLLGPTQLQGNWTSPTFTTTAANWNIGWAFRCAPAPAAGASFQVFVTPAGSSPTGTPAISETGPTGQSVTAQSSTGSQTLVVQAPPSCTWVVKITGS